VNHGLKQGSQDRRLALFAFACGDQRDGALVLTGGGIQVNAFVRLRRDRQRERQKQRGE
jgi:hypothetical protein